MPDHAPDKPRSLKEERRERLAAALRDNLRKRKAQARARAASSPSGQRLPASQPAGASEDTFSSEDAKRHQ